MTTVTLLTQADCHYCDHAKDVLTRVSLEHRMVIEELGLDTAQGRALATQHGVLFAPGILIDGEPFGFGRLSERKLRRHLSRVAPRQ